MVERLFKLAFVVVFIVAAGYALLLLAFLFLTAFVHCGCVAPPSPAA